MIRTGTSHYRSEREARAAYPLTYEDAMLEGRIQIGKPTLKPGETLLVDEDGRYHIETPECDHDFEARAADGGAISMSQPVISVCAKCGAKEQP